MVDYKDTKWQRDESGKLVIPEAQSDFIDWLLDEYPYPDTEEEWCKEYQVARGTVKKWKQDRRFKQEWERRAQEKVVSPERLQAVVDSLFRSATNTGDVGAAQKYLAWAEKFLPPKEIRRDNSVAHLTDAELVADIQALLDEGIDVAA